ncbi:MAG: hypothetical protein MK086_00450 [Flavobacteriales bacterium]|nr:hypothetical protein [Flavobacteriales bacterium]
MIRSSLLLCLFSFVFLVSTGQSKKVKTYGVTKRTETAVEYKDGEEVSRFTKEVRFYDKDGWWIEKTIYTSSGEKKSEEKRTFDNGDLIEEIKVDYDGSEAKDAEPPSFKSKTYQYHRGDLIVERFLSKKGQTKKEKRYNYNDFGDEVEVGTFDATGILIKKLEIEYDKRGFKVREVTSDASGKVLKEKLYSYE